MSLKRVWIPSPNCSSRQGASVRLIVVHTAEGAQTYQDLGRYFQTPGLEASSHVGIDSTPGTIGEYVRRSDKAWTVASYNPVSVNAELCAFADWTTDQWFQHPAMLENCGRWIAEEAAALGIPIVRLSASEAQGSGRGVCGHVDLGSAGGGHHDPGPGFPWNHVLSIARGGKPPPAPAPAPKPPPAGKAPPFPGTLLANYIEGHGTKTWQGQMAHRGWTIAVDDKYGGQSEGVCRQFQAEKGLGVDGIVGPQTWDATWTAPIT